MNIVVNGVPVRQEELKNDIELKFEDLNEKGQRRVFLENKGKFIFDAFTSEYTRIQKLPLKYQDEYDSDTLNKTISFILKNTRISKNTDIILTLLNNKNLKLYETLRSNLATCDYPLLKVWVAQSKDTSVKLLNTMFIYEASNLVCLDYTMVFDAIIQNPNFVLTEQTKKIIPNIFSSEQIKKIKERICELKS